MPVTEGDGPFDPGTVVHITATPAADYLFSGWTGDTVENSNASSTTVTMNADRSITANFVRNGIKLSYSQDGKYVTLTAEDFLNGDAQAGDLVYFEAKRHDVVKNKDFITKSKSVVVDANGSCPTAVLKLKNGDYQINGFCKTAGKSSALQNCTIASVAALTPIDKAVVYTATPTVTWGGFTGASGYIVQTSTSKKFPVGIYTIETAVGNVTSAELPSLTLGAKMYWRVIAIIPTGRSVPSTPRLVTYN